MSFRIVHYDDFKQLSLHDAKAVLKYARMARKWEKETARKKRYAEFIKRRKAQNWDE